MRTLGIRMPEEMHDRLEAVFEAESREFLPTYSTRGETLRRLLSAALALYEAGGWERLEHAS